jgi:hypothetical protein
MSSLTLPAWGYLRDGALYELPTPEHPTIEQGYSSLPTPMARDYKDESLPPRLWGPKAYESELPTAVALHLMPTPRAQNGEQRNQTIYKRNGPQNLENALALLPTPINSDYNTPASEWMESHDRLQLRDIKALLPTPAVNDMGAGKDPQACDEWAARQKAADGRPAPHGKSLEQEALRVGVTTHQPSIAGSTSLDDAHQAPLFNEQGATA